MFYAALDVSLRSVAVCIIDDDGKVRLERSVPSDVPDLVRFMLATGDAHGLYEQFGFTAPQRPDTLMERYFPNIYVS